MSPLIKLNNNQMMRPRAVKASDVVAEVVAVVELHSAIMRTRGHKLRIASSLQLARMTAIPPGPQKISNLKADR
jgi:hypothetical protein